MTKLTTRTAGAARGMPHPKTKTRILFASLMPMTLVLAVGVFASFKFTEVKERSDWVEHTHQVLAEVHLIVAAGVNMETGLRGFLLAGNDDYLTPFEAGEQAAYERISDLQVTVSDNPPQVERLEEAERLLRDWHTHVALPMMELRRAIGDAPTMNDMAATVQETEETRIFDQFRTQMAEIVKTENMALNEQRSLFGTLLSVGSSSRDDVTAGMDVVQKIQSRILLGTRLQATATDMETAMRGYLLTGEEAFLKKFAAAAKKVKSLSKRLSFQFKTAPDQLAKLDGALATFANWQTSVAQPTMELRQLIGDAKTMDDMADLVGEGLGKQYFDAFRDVMAEFAAIEEALMVERQAANLSAFTQMQTLIPASIAIALVLGAGVALWIGTGISGAVKRLTASMGALKDGDLDAAIADTKRRDELGDMSRSLEIFREALKKMRAMEETERRRAAQQQAVMAALSVHLSRFSGGDLTASINTAFPEDFESLRSDYNATVGRMRDVVQELVRTAQSINGGAQQLEASAGELSRRTETQAATLEETAAAIEDFSGTVHATADSARQASQGALQAKNQAEEGSGVVKNTIGAMSKIENSASEISKIVTMIDDIAFQTNLLALNAGVEAARAGAQGKGFAVVASEVQKLAQRSAEAATDIKELIESSARQVESGSKLVNQTGDMLGRIVTAVMAVSEQISGIADAAANQSTNLGEIKTSISHLDTVTQQNAAMVEQASSATSVLAGDTKTLHEVTSSFTLHAPAEARDHDDHSLQAA